MLVPKFNIGMDISTYLSHIRRVVFCKRDTGAVVVVLGNPSCDLDSFVCSLVLSYFYNGGDLTKTTKQTLFVPVLNLPDVRAKDLWRFRPEFGVALRGAIDNLTPQSRELDSKQHRQHLQDRDRSLLEQLITIHEITDNDSSLHALRQAFRPSTHPRLSEDTKKQDLILVDHNAPAFESINPDEYAERFNIIGCIDHHVEENYVPKSADPRIVKLGIGSCMSLVANYLRDARLWNKHANLPDGQRQISRLALAPVLIDTWNLKASGDKCSALDKEIATFLTDQAGNDFNPQDLFEQASIAKNESLRLLSTEECIARDYKSYVQHTKRNGDLNIGITSLVKDLNWMSEHADGAQQFAQDIITFAFDPKRKLEVLGMLTRSGERKQLAIFAFGVSGANAIDIFESTAGELQLSAWDDDDEIKTAFNQIIGEKQGIWKVWWMGDTTKSRKQVAPLLRDALGDA